MKKYLTLSFYSVLVCTICMAQKNTTEYGISGGLNINSANGNNVSKTYKTNLTGIGFGGSIKYHVSKHLGIRTLLQYDRNGWIYRLVTVEDINQNWIANADIFFKFDYLNVPVLAEYSVGNNVKFKASAGAFVGFLIKNRIETKITRSSGPVYNPNTKFSSDSYKSENLGLSFGAGLQIALSSKLKFDFDLRDNYGILNINKGEGTTKTNSFSIQTGLTFSK